MSVQSICNKNQAIEKNKNKQYFMKEQFKIFSIFTDFRQFLAFSVLPKKSLRHILQYCCTFSYRKQFQINRRNPHPKILKNGLDIGFFVRLVSIIIVLAPCQIVDFEL